MLNFCNFSKIIRFFHPFIIIQKNRRFLKNAQKISVSVLIKLYDNDNVNENETENKQYII